jgi:hypothetical protein
LAAVPSVAASTTGLHFVLIGGGDPTENVAVLPSAGGSSLSARVATVVQDAVGGDYRSGIES